MLKRNILIAQSYACLPRKVSSAVFSGANSRVCVPRFVSSLVTFEFCKETIKNRVAEIREACPLKYSAY